MTQGLIVRCDRFAIGCNAERARDLQGGVALRQLPQATEQAVRHASREDQPAGAEHPQRLAREHRELAGLLAGRDHGQLGLPAVTCGHARRL